MDVNFIGLLDDRQNFIPSTHDSGADWGGTYDPHGVPVSDIGKAAANLLVPFPIGLINGFALEKFLQTQDITSRPIKQGHTLSRRTLFS